MRKVIIVLAMLILLLPLFAEDYKGTEVDLTSGDYSFISDVFGMRRLAPLRDPIRPTL